MMEAKTKKGLIVTALVLGVGYVIYKMLKKPSTPTSTEIDNAFNLPQGSTGVNPTLSQDKMNELADKMYIAFNGYGTDVNGNNGLMNLFASIKNNDDLMGVIGAYGIRKIDSGRFNPFSDFEGNLPESLANELSDSDLNKINSILVKNGVNIRFASDGTLTTL